MDYVIPFSGISKASLSLVGGKGANLGEMLNAGFPVPNGICITTVAYETFVANSTKMSDFFLELQELQTNDLAQVQDLGQRIRQHLESEPIPEDIQNAIQEGWSNVGEEKSYAVRSSATAEDLPSASFAGQQDTYLNIRGFDSILDAVRRCWASLFTDRAIIYRARNQFQHQEVLLSVVIQELVIPEVSGIMFTADPVSGNRKIVTIDASYGLGEALVSGLVTADNYQVREDQIITKSIGSKKLAIYSLTEGGTVTKDLSEEKQNAQAMSDELILKVAAIGKRIESHYGCEQDIEWCVTAERELYIVQSRPITTLYPLAYPLPTDGTLHVYFSFGHAQMMTKAITPLGRSVVRTIVPIGHTTPGDESHWAVSAASRLYIDLSNILRIPTIGEAFTKFAVNIDEQISVGLKEVIKRPEFHDAPPPKGYKMTILRVFVPLAWRAFLNVFFINPEPAQFQANLLMEEAVANYERRLNEVTGAERIRLMQLSLQDLFPSTMVKLAPHVFPGFMAMALAEKLSKKWLGDSDEIAVMNRSLPGNVTTEMGLRVGDLGDCVRERPAVLQYLKSATSDETFYKGLQDIKGGSEFQKELDSFLAQYGMRAPGEIDIGTTRWIESPTSLIPSILSVASNQQSSGEHRRKHIQANEEAEEAARRNVERVRNTPWGYFKAILMRRLVRTFRYRAGMREHPKYTLIRIFWISKKILLDEGTRLVDSGTLDTASDILYLSLPEVYSVLANTFEDDLKMLVSQRKDQHIKDDTLYPVRLMTSDGEVVNCARQSSTAPEGAILGSGVSSGVVEGFARVVLSPNNAELKDGEIMIAPFTDPGWTPLFNSAKALVISVGGMLTHGAVVAREYGIPAVVGVDNATEVIKTGQYIRVNGDEGYIMVLPAPEEQQPQDGDEVNA
ncbi:pyruvate phosphate dikinase PEP/pyruvate-binding protein [Umbelopsis sp. PMI_123]|nr:pyruvate phosphate dikinase PEP/pyruvate-binding protein [Umbelopsis sp. PMI_123]